MLKLPAIPNLSVSDPSVIFSELPAGPVTVAVSAPIVTFTVRIILPASAFLPKLTPKSLKVTSGFVRTTGPSVMVFGGARAVLELDDVVFELKFAP